MLKYQPNNETKSKQRLDESKFLTTIRFQVSSRGVTVIQYPFLFCTSANADIKFLHILEWILEDKYKVAQKSANHLNNIHIYSLLVLL